MKKTLLALIILLSGAAGFSQTTIRICKDVRNITFQSITTLGTPISWQWTITGGTYTGPLTNSTCGPVAYNTVGTYLTTCLTKFSTGKDSLQKITVIVFDGAVVPPTFKDTTICGNINLTLDAGNGGNAIAKYKWTPTNTTAQTLKVTAPGTYGVSIYTVDDYSYNCVNCVACDSLYRGVVIKKGVKPVVDLGPDRFICNSNPITLDAGTDGNDYVWTPNGEITQTLQVSTSGRYSVTVKNSDGCITTDQINVKDSCPLYIYVPNVFTPNDDLINELFKWKGNLTTKSYNMSIFNRWGEKLFDTDDPAAGWDGKYKNNLVQEGNYIYVITCIDTNGERRTLKGSVTLLY